MILTARLWDLENERSNPRVLSGHIAGIVTVAVTPDGKWALTGSSDTTARLWNLENERSIPRVLSGHIWHNIFSRSDPRWEVGYNWIW